MASGVYPGSFDPVHNGHVDVASRAAKLFDRLVIGQSAGDYQALTNRGRRVLRVNLGDEPASGLAAVVELASV